MAKTKEQMKEIQEHMVYCYDSYDDLIVQID